MSAKKGLSPKSAIQCADQLSEITAELRLLASLFELFDPEAALDAEEVVGAGLILKRLTQRLEEVRGQIAL